MEPAGTCAPFASRSSIIISNTCRPVLRSALDLEALVGHLQDGPLGPLPLPIFNGSSRSQWASPDLNQI